MTDKPWHCKDKGHVWAESDGRILARKRDLGKTEKIAVTCTHCGKTVDVTGWGDRIRYVPAKGFST